MENRKDLQSRGGPGKVTAHILVFMAALTIQCTGMIVTFSFMRFYLNFIGADQHFTEPMAWYHHLLLGVVVIPIGVGVGLLIGGLICWLLAKLFLPKEWTRCKN